MTPRKHARASPRKETASRQKTTSPCKRVTPWGVITVRSGRPLSYTPRLKAHIKYRWEETSESAYSIAVDFGVHPFSLRRLATREGWVRHNPPPSRDITSVMRLAAAADALAGAAPIGHGHPTPDGLRPSDPPGEGGTARAAPAPPDLSAIDRLEQAVLKELTTVETMRASLGAEPLRPMDAERTARTLSVLTETLAKLRRLRLGAQPQPDLTDDDIPDIDAFRLDLARRIETFLESREADGDAQRDSGPVAIGEAGP